MHIPRTRLTAATAAAALTLAAAAAVSAPAEAKPKPPAKTVTVNLIGFNDFHGAIDKPTGSQGNVNGTPAGGVEYLATAVKNLRAQQKQESPYSFTVGAGDLVGATPLVSAAFHDEPVVDEMNAMGLDITSVGNHEFDEGVNELLRLQRGGCHPTDGCQDGDGFRGAEYPMLAANVVYRQNNEPILKPYVVKKVDGVKVGFVGMTLEGTPSIVNPAGITNVNFLDESQTANRYAQQLRRQGVHSLVLLLHEGGFQSASTDPNACSGFSGPLADIVSRLAPEYGAVVSGHTHTWYACDDELQNSIGENVLVTSAGSNGRMITDIGITIDKRTKQIVSAEGQNLIVQNSDPALIDAAAKTIADKYRTAVAPIANRVVGSISADITNAANAAGESALGDVIADGMLAYTQADGAQLAFMNPGGIRASLIYNNSPGGEAAGQVTYGETFTVQPFNNLVATVTLTGAQIKDVLEQQFVGYKGQASTKFLQVSQGFTYSYDTTRALGDRISNLQLNGTALDPAATYRVTTNDFVANGGDGFTTMTVGTDRTTAPGFDVDALAAYLSPGPVAPGPMNRITKLG